MVYNTWCRICTLFHGECCAWSCAIRYKYLIYICIEIVFNIWPENNPELAGEKRRCDHLKISVWKVTAKYINWQIFLTLISVLRPTWTRDCVVKPEEPALWGCMETAAHPLKNTLYASREYPLKTELYAILRLRGGKSFFYWCLRWKLVPDHIYAEFDDIKLIIYWCLRWKLVSDHIYVESDDIKLIIYWCLRWKLVPDHIYAESNDIMLIIYCVPAWILKWTQFFLLK